MLKSRIPYRKESFGGLAYDRHDTHGGYFYINDTCFDFLRLIDKNDLEICDFNDTDLKESINILIKKGIIEDLDLKSVDHKLQNNFRGGKAFLTDSSLGSPTSVDIYPNFLCNYRCKFCYVGDLVSSPPKQSLNHDIFEKWVTNLFSSGVFHVGILGGEPLLYKYLNKVIVLLNDKNFHVSIASNGFYASVDRLEFLKEQHVDINFSIQGSTKETHEKLVKRNNSFERAKNALKTSSKLGLSFLMSTVVTPENINEIQDIIKMGSDLGATDISLFFPERTSFTLKNKMEISFSSYVEVLRKSMELGNKLGIRVDSNCHFDFLLNENKNKFALNTPASKFLYGDKSFNSRIDIMPNGDMYPNYEFFGIKEYCLGNINSESVSNCWTQSDIMKRMRGKTLPTICKKCNYKEICQGGFLSRIIKKDLTERPDYCPLIDEELTDYEINNIGQ